MKPTLTLLAFLVSSTLFAQRTSFTDSMSVEICKTFTNEVNLEDSVRVQYAFFKHAEAFISRFEAKEADEMMTRVYFQMQKTCPEFYRVLEALTPSTTSWKMVDKEPASRASEKDCREFFTYKELSYLEATGDTTRLVVNGNSWTDMFTDGTYSKLSLEKKNNCDFTITFIESNNMTRSSLSKKGDRFRYKILSKENGYYNMFLEVIGAGIMGTFRIYYK